MRPGTSAFVRPDCKTNCSLNHAMMHGGPCGSCPMGTNPGRTHRFYTGKAVVPFGFGEPHSLTSTTHSDSLPAHYWAVMCSSPWLSHAPPPPQDSPTPHSSTALSPPRPRTASQSLSTLRATSSPTRPQPAGSSRTRTCWPPPRRWSSKFTPQRPVAPLFESPVKLLRWRKRGRVPADQSS